MKSASQQVPLIYSCSGASSAAQMANHLAVRLDRTGLVEMSCIAGVGGDVPSLVRTAQSGRAIVALDGCPLACVARSLARHGLVPDHHYVLSDQGVPKRAHEDFNVTHAERLLAQLTEELRNASPASASELEAELSAVAVTP